MRLVLETQDISSYLQRSDVIDFDSPAIAGLAYSLSEGISDEIQLVTAVYEYIRDEIDHSGDINASTMTCNASQVLAERHGICCAKSHLLAAVLRCLNIPTGLCYQWLASDNSENLQVLHGLNAVYLRPIDKWIRLDARGNKPGVQAEFSIDTEKLAWPVRTELGEADDPVIYAAPKPEVVQALRESLDRDGFWKKWSSIGRITNL